MLSHYYYAINKYYFLSVKFLLSSFIYFIDIGIIIMFIYCTFMHLADTSCILPRYHTYVSSTLFVKNLVQQENVYYQEYFIYYYYYYYLYIAQDLLLRYPLSWILLIANFGLIFSFHLTLLLSFVM